MNRDERQCPYCGEMIKSKAKKCRYCGEYIKTNEENNLNNKNIILVGVIILLCVLTIINLFVFISSKNNSDDKNIGAAKVEEQKTVQTPTVVQNHKNYNDILSKIDRYQAQYWQIVKRSDVLVRLSEDGDEIANKDLSDLKRLDRAVIGQIDKNNIYLKKYYNTKNNYSNCSGETTYDMSISASQDYKDIDKLLNEVYQVLRKNLPPDDFEKLKQSEIKWIKDCDKYQELILLRDEYGSWGRQVGIICAETAFREFRTLLLLLYF